MTERFHVVFGPPAAGKTTYARQLAGRIGAAVFDSDEVAERLVRAGLSLAGMDPDDRDSPAYKAAYRDVVYETLYDLARSNLPNVAVVIAGPFTREGGEVDWPERLLKRVGAMPKFHFVWCPREVRRDRALTRGAGRDRPKLVAWDNYATTCRDIPPVFPHEWVVTG